MDQATQVRILKELMRQVDEGVNVDAGVQMRNPVSAYTCKNLARQEWETLFKNYPQVIGLSSDLPDAHSFFTVDDFGVPVLATRDAEGQVHAFLNACRHRGVRVADDTRGQSRAFICPFHNWTYSSTGALLGMPRAHDFGAIDHNCHGLIKLPVVERYGLIWVHPKPDGKLDVDALLGPLAAELAGWSLNAFHYCGASVIKKDLNWKLANDTFGETYHFARLHKKTLAGIAESDCLSYETFERNHRFVFPSKRLMALREKPESAWHIRGPANVLYYLFPNIQLAIGRDDVSLIKLYPDADNPGRSITRIWHYFSERAIAADRNPDADVKILSDDNVYDMAARTGKSTPSIAAVMEIFDSTVEKEDYAMGESTQRSAESGLLEYVVFGRNEPALHHYHNTFREVLGMPPLEIMAAPEPAAEVDAGVG